MATMTLKEIIAAIIDNNISIEKVVLGFKGKSTKPIEQQIIALKANIKTKAAGDATREKALLKEALPFFRKRHVKNRKEAAINGFPYQAENDSDLTVIDNEIKDSDIALETDLLPPEV